MIWVHAQNIEIYWNRVKKRFKSMKGATVNSYFDEFMWRDRYVATSEEVLNSSFLTFNLQVVVLDIDRYWS